jgi:hypothetical protein
LGGGVDGVYVLEEKKGRAYSLWRRSGEACEETCGDNGHDSEMKKDCKAIVMKLVCETRPCSWTYKSKVLSVENPIDKKRTGKVGMILEYKNYLEF